MEQDYPVQDIRNSYLVGLGVKPASAISRSFNAPSMEALPQALAYRATLHELLYTAGVVHYDFTLSLDEKTKARVNQGNYSGAAVCYLDCFFGADRHCLTALINAHNAHDDRALGEAYGFPKSAIDAFCAPSNPVRAGDIWKQLIDGRNAGKEIPVWYSYINHVPTRMNLVSGDVCPESEKLGTMYRQAIRQKHPKLIPVIDPNAEAKTPLRYHESNGEIEYYFA